MRALEALGPRERADDPRRAIDLLPDVAYLEERCAIALGLRPIRREAPGVARPARGPGPSLVFLVLAGLVKRVDEGVESCQWLFTLGLDLLGIMADGTHEIADAGAAMCRPLSVRISAFHCGRLS